MKRIFYYTTTAIIISCGITQAQTCVPTPTCSSLGYTSTTACDGGLKCPFGEAWNCSINEIKTEITEKITELEKKVEEIELIVTRPNSALKFCGVGNIFYSDWTCSIELDSSKTPIGVVVYDDGLGHGQVMALKSIGSKKWATVGTGTFANISTLSDYDTAEIAQYDTASCANSAKIMTAGNKSKYPAVWAANEYSTEGTSAGDWCLPAAGILTSLCNNLDAINTGLSRAKGVKFSSGAWSSSENYSTKAWEAICGNEYGLGDNVKDTGNEVRPVLAFQVFPK